MASPGADPVSDLFERLRPDMLRFAWWLCRDRAVAEDVVQEALLRAWKSRSELRETEAAKPWLLTIVRREHARLYERRRLETTNLDDVIETQTGSLSVDADIETLNLRLAMLRLPDEYREPLVMQVLGGFSTAEIAAELNLTQTAVLTRVFRARAKLRESFGLAPLPAGEQGED